MVIKTNLELIMAEIGDHWTTGPRDSSGTRPDYANQPVDKWPKYTSEVRPALKGLASSIGFELKVSGNYPDTAANKVVPYVMFRPTLSTDAPTKKQGLTHPLKTISTQYGAYIGYLFPADGDSVYLVLMYATKQIDDKSKDTLTSIAKSYHDHVNIAF